MSVFTSTKHNKEASKVHNSQYIKTENKPDEPVETPNEPAKPEESESK